MANGDLLPSLVRRIAAARGKHKLEGLLRETRDRLGLGRAIRVTGNLAQLGNSVQGAIVDGHISVQTIRDLVDEVEETGGQHIFLYRLTPSGRGNLTVERLAGAFDAPPQGVTSHYYGDEPQRQTNFLVRDGKLFVKQVYTAEYWETNEDESERGATRRVTVQELRRRRAVNLLFVDPLAGEAEIRIDRVHGNDHGLALTELERFEQTLASVSDVTEDLQPIAIRANFRALVQDRVNTYMAVDRAQDQSVAQTISSRRQGTNGTDVRDHPRYGMDGEDYIRDSASIYWQLDAEQRVYTFVSAVDVEVDDEVVEHTKVYVSAKVTPEELAHVLGRIRQFAV